MAEDVKIPMTQDDADDAARIVADLLEPHIHARLVKWIEDSTLPDIGFMKLREMAQTLAQESVRPTFNTLVELGHPERCPVANKGRRRKRR